MKFLQGISARSLVLVLAAGMYSNGSAKMNHSGSPTESHAVKIWTPEAWVLSLISRGGGGGEEVDIDLKFNTAVKVYSAGLQSEAYKRAFEKRLSQSDVDHLKSILEPLWLVEKKAKVGPAPGGSWSFVVTYQDRFIDGVRWAPEHNRILSREEGVPAGTSYYQLDEATSKRLFECIYSLFPR